MTMQQSLAAQQGAAFRAANSHAARQARRPVSLICTGSAADSTKQPVRQQCPEGRRAVLAALTAVAAASAVPQPPAAQAASDFVQTASGLLVQDITVGQGRQPQPGDVCIVHWAGYTKNYQAKRYENTSLRDEPFEFVLGRGQVIPAFDEAVAGMRVGGVRRIEVLGEIPELSYPRDRAERFVSPFKYRYGPQPSELGGQRALDFVLDNNTLNATNRTLLIDIRLLSTRPAGQ